MPERGRATLPFRAGFARGRGQTAVQNRDLRFKVAFEDMRAERRLKEIGLQFQMAQKRMETAAAIEKNRQQEKAGAEALGIEAARRGEEVNFKNPYSSLAYAETRRQMGAREQVATERRKTLSETFERGLEAKGFEKVTKPSVDVQFLGPGEEPGPLKSQEGTVRVGGQTFRKPSESVDKLMGQVSQAAREFVLRDGEPKTPQEFRERLRGFHKLQFEQTEAKTRNEALSDAEDAFRSIFSDVKDQDGYQAQFDSINEWLESIGFSKEEIATVAKINYKGKNKTEVQWSKLRNMLFQKRLARVGGAAATTTRQEGSVTQQFLDSVENE